MHCRRVAVVQVAVVEVAAVDGHDTLRSQDLETVTAGALAGCQVSQDDLSYGTGMAGRGMMLDRMSRDLGGGGVRRGESR